MKEEEFRKTMDNGPRDSASDFELMELSDRQRDIGLKMFHEFRTCLGEALFGNPKPGEFEQIKPKAPPHRAPAKKRHLRKIVQASRRRNR